MPLTDTYIKSLKPKDKLYREADGHGLCLEISPAGSKLWRMRYYYDGKAQMTAVGKWPTVSLADARQRRDEIRKLLDAGKHPTREKKAQKLRTLHEGENTFESIARKALSTRQEKHNEKYRKQCLARMEQHVFPHIGNLPISEITIPDVVRIIEKISKAGTIETARRMRQSINQVFRYASQRGMCNHNPAADLRDILPSKEEKHHPCVSIKDFPNLMEKMDNYDGELLTRYAMRLLVLTFVRTGELIKAKWDEIDWDKQEWHIPKERMKMKRPHVVPLSRQTITLLREIQKITGNKAYIFYSSQSKSKHLSNGVVLMALRRMGYGGKMTGHGFRTVASTILNEKDYNRDWIERQLAHEDNDKVRSAYNRAEYLPERKIMMQDYADYIDKIRRA